MQRFARKWMFACYVMPISNDKCFTLSFVEKCGTEADAALLITHLDLERTEDIFVVQRLILHSVASLRKFSHSVPPLSPGPIRCRVDERRQRDWIGPVADSRIRIYFKSPFCRHREALGPGEWPVGNRKSGPPAEASQLVRLGPSGGIVASARGFRMGRDWRRTVKSRAAFSRTAATAAAVGPNGPVTGLPFPAVAGLTRPWSLLSGDFRGSPILQG